MRWWLLVLLAVSCWASASSDDSLEEWNSWQKKDALVILDDSNFEKLTQARSGHTTGHWFVMFGARWCGYCRSMMEEWNKTALSLRGSDTSVAYVDTGKNPFLSLRFNITMYPTLLLFREGSMYEYRGDRSRHLMVEFTASGYLLEEPREVPPDFGTFDEIVLQMQEYSGKLIRLWETSPYVFMGSVFAGVFFGCFLPFMYVMSAPEGDYFEIARAVEKKQEGSQEAVEPTAVASNESNSTEPGSASAETVTGQSQSVTDRKKNKHKNKT